MTRVKNTDFENVTNGAKNLIDLSAPYTATIEVTGTADMLMHCWNNEAVAEKASAKKNSAAKKTDDLETYVLRDNSGKIVMPTLNFCASIREAGKSFADPTSPRKSLKDRLKAILIPEEKYGVVVSVTGKECKDWDYVDSRRVVIQRAGITRRRPGFYEGWKITFKIQILEPEYLSPSKLQEIVEAAGKFQGLGDFRPTFGRFRVTSFSTKLI